MKPLHDSAILQSNRWSCLHLPYTREAENNPAHAVHSQFTEATWLWAELWHCFQASSPLFVLPASGPAETGMAWKAGALQDALGWVAVGWDPCSQIVLFPHRAVPWSLLSQQKEDVVSTGPFLSLLCPGHIFPSLMLLCYLIPPAYPWDLSLDSLKNAGQLLVPRNGAGCSGRRRRGKRCRRTAQPGENTLKNKSKETRRAREKNSDESLNSASLSGSYLSCGTWVCV